MTQSATPRPSHFTVFRSAAEEIADASARDEWANEGGHMRAKSGRIVQTPDATMPYKVVLDHEDGEDTEAACATIREGEAMIRRSTPRPTRRDASRDHDETAS